MCDSSTSNGSGREERTEEHSCACAMLEREGEIQGARRLMRGEDCYTNIEVVKNVKI